MILQVNEYEQFLEMKLVGNEFAVGVHDLLNARIDTEIKALNKAHRRELRQKLREQEAYEEELKVRHC